MYCCVVGADFCVGFTDAVAFNGDVHSWDVSRVESLSNSKLFSGLCLLAVGERRGWGVYTDEEVFGLINIV